MAPADVAFEERALGLDGRQSLVPKNDRTADLGAKALRERLRVLRALTGDSRHQERVSDDDDGNLVFANEIDQGVQVAANRPARQAPHWLTGDAERIGQSQSDAHGAEIYGENAPGAFDQWPPATGALMVGFCGSAACLSSPGFWTLVFAMTSAIDSFIALSSG